MTFREHDHPRSAVGTFTEKVNSDPVAVLGADGDVHSIVQPFVARAAAGVDVPHSVRMTARCETFNAAAGTQHSVMDIERAFAPRQETNDPEIFERECEALWWRAKSGHYDENLDLVPVDPQALRTADWAGEAVAEAEIGTAGEIASRHAQVFAEDILQNLPEGRSVLDYPNLSRFAAEPFIPEALDEFHSELGDIYPDVMSHRRRRAIDHLFTFTIHGEIE